MDKPLRAHSITITAGADTHEALVAELKQIIFDIQRGSRNSVSGGASTNHIINYVIDPEMTHDRYMDLLDQYIAEHVND